MADLSGLHTQNVEPEGILEAYDGVPSLVVRFAQRVYALMGKDAAIGIQFHQGVYAIWRFEVRHGKKIYTKLKWWESQPVDIPKPPVVEPTP